MKPLHLVKLFCFLIYKLYFVSCVPKENFGYKNVKYFADPDYKLSTQYYRYSNTEFDHAVDDERCNGRPQDSRSVVKNTQYGNIRGRQIYLCDRPGLLLRERPGQSQAFGTKGSVRVFLGIPYAEPPVRRRNAENLQFKVIIYVYWNLFW